MTKEELEIKLKALDIDHKMNQDKAIKQFCDANNPYKVNDKFTDHIGTVIIEKIRYSYTVSGTPCCIYFGTVLKKDGNPKLSGEKRNAWQSNDVSNSIK